MNVSASVVVKRVLMLLNESEEELDSAVIYGDMGMEIRRLVRDLLVEGVTKTFRDANLEDVDEVMYIRGGYSYQGDGAGELGLPEDYLRLVELRMSDWDTSLYACCEASPLPEESAQKEEDNDHDDEDDYEFDEDDYARTWLRHHPVNGGDSDSRKQARAAVEPVIPPVDPTPVVPDDLGAHTGAGVLPGFNSKGRVLRIFGVNPNSSVEIAAYLPTPDDEDDTVWIPRGLINSVARTLADMVKSIIGEEL